jgi:hypothetical protein
MLPVPLAVQVKVLRIMFLQELPVGVYPVAVNTWSLEALALKDSVNCVVSRP